MRDHSINNEQEENFFCLYGLRMTQEDLIKLAENLEKAFP